MPLEALSNPTTSTHYPLFQSIQVTNLLGAAVVPALVGVARWHITGTLLRMLVTEFNQVDAQDIRSWETKRRISMLETNDDSNITLLRDLIGKI